MSLSAALLKRLAPWHTAPTWRVAFSGGLDSTVLLHLLAQLAKKHSLPELKAIHIHHGLQAAADAWPGHCQTVCDALGVPLEVIHVQVQPGASLERAAREARYGAFVEATQTNELLLTAQHQNDQAETLLFRLLRGAGVRGLSAIPSQRPLGSGFLLRPLLEVSRAELEAYAVEHRLSWIEDPSNADQQFSRNYLRQQIFPALTQRWPQAVATIARSAAHLSEAQGLLDDLAEMDLAPAATVSEFDWLGVPSLEMAALETLSAARQRNALSHWLAPLTRMPDSDHWSGWENLRDAATDARPIWRLADGELHRANGRIWWLSGHWLNRPEPAPLWPDPSLALLLPNNGRVTFSGTIPAGVLSVRYRQGGEIMHLPGRGHRDLKRLLNESGLPLFARGRLPLLFCNEQLLAVANLRGLDGSAGGNGLLRWQPAINDQGLS
ncbi:tRNA lysidine(34) synthetase TilS [Pseudomonas sp. FW306-02-F02-AA]|uniref:tRNA(Ile)-lysidine synthase n=1 Tax=Pseudomonas fluorescens TaxID=294 RepID=A0A0N9WRJ9_PSEFL|nr:MULTISPECIES: tRNA lysidine(34) synthetase TilS [Pseudomonas]ALI05087.1 tRNA(Ile)-lysidine synthetase [Pseudomonas fluorescens]PMZ05185.1 tRNA lysidine(34) synthetase TilS [Pseudomonas sp. FW306-02-F02-AB]PMZ10967.1 tRNA lysidine(34) synthetase TilS [Pseudomonas sp. FW306-02-H06C]PMZ15324.1 tRNA lysidine(34) synthetase TilS [Pseudomonas sp. FW306-02-F02-AA]PMZ22642.1 tRNA lysidine(34) synthetase TilS [Pseudomonas sp. FW306-02-F08-AA]